jgi:hypothetical protein
MKFLIPELLNGSNSPKSDFRLPPNFIPDVHPLRGHSLFLQD